MLDAINWAGKRIGLVTRSLEIKTNLVSWREGDFGPGRSLPLIHALKMSMPGKACLSSVRSFSFDVKDDGPTQNDAAAITSFRDWVLERAPHIEALRIPMEPCHAYAACAVRLQHLKHVEMDADAFAQGVSEAAKQLPCLETLHLHVHSGSHGEISVLGCLHLRHMVLQGRYGKIRSVLHEPKCRLGIHVDVCGTTRLKPQDWEALQQSIEGAMDFVYSLEDYFPYGAPPIPCKVLRGHLKPIETLTLDWPVHWDLSEGKYFKHIAVVNAKDMVKCCMPVGGQPLGSLKVLILRSEGAIDCCIPSGLPNLEELVLFAEGFAKVSFEDPKATFTALKAFHIYGEPLRMDREDELQTLNVAASKGSRVSHVSADRRWTRSCMYLRPIMAPELTFEELHDRVRGLARQCRCKACFECLRRAGCLTWH